MNGNNTEKKNQRISKMQKQILVDFMSSNLEFARGQFGGVNSNSNSKEEWESLKTSLNSLGGSDKSVDQWIKCWADLTGGVKELVNKSRSFRNGTGGGSWAIGPRELNVLEETILHIITKDAVDGDACTPESGVTMEEVPDKCVLAIEILDDEDILFPPSKKMLSIASLYKEALAESRSMHAALMAQMLTVESQNKIILKKLSVIEEKLNSQQNLP